jgi:hypothetical protein
MGMQALYCAYFAHIIVRAAYMTLFAGREVFSKVS